MTETVARDPNRCPTHPGAFLREIVMPEIDATKVVVARSLGISRQTLYDILNEKQPVTPDMAVRLAAFFGGSDRSWLNMQAAFDLWHARRRIEVGKIPKVEQTIRRQNTTGTIEHTRAGSDAQGTLDDARKTKKVVGHKGQRASASTAASALSEGSQRAVGRNVAKAGAKRARRPTRKKRG